MRGLDDIRRAAERQHGNVTHAQLVSAGLSAREIEQRIDCGWLIRRHKAVFALGHVPPTRESRWAAAVLALGEGAVLSHRAAGALWELVDGSVPTEVIVPTYAGRPRRDGIVVHRQRLPGTHLSARHGIPVTTPIRTILDLASVLPFRALARSFEQAQVRHHIPPEPLAAEVIARPRQRGNARLKLLLAGAVDPAAVRSVLELRFLRLCAANGIPRPLVNGRIGAWTPDFVWPDERLIVETDGYEFHRTEAAKRRDALKDEHMRAAGYTVIRLTWADVAERPAQVAEMISPPSRRARGACAPAARARAA